MEQPGWPASGRAVVGLEQAKAQRDVVWYVQSIPIPQAVSVARALTEGDPPAVLNVAIQHAQNVGGEWVGDVRGIKEFGQRGFGCGNDLWHGVNSGGVRGCGGVGRSRGKRGIRQQMQVLLPTRLRGSVIDVEAEETNVC